MTSGSDQTLSDIRLGGGFTRLRVDRLLGLVIGGVCIVFGIQAAVASAGSVENGKWHLPLVIVVFSALGLFIVTGILGRGFRFASGLFVFVYIAVLVVWLNVSTTEGIRAEAQPWIWYLVNIATVGASIAFRPWIGIAFTVALPIAYAAVRITQGEGAPDFWVSNIADNSFSLIFGLVITMLVVVFRSVADGVDTARSKALETYGAAAAAEAADQERVAIAALMHDSVLSALIAAERADSPRERELSVAMASDALAGLANAESEHVTGSEAPVSAVQITRSLERAAAVFGLELEIAEPAPFTVPDRVARAITLAATQAIANAVQHAGAVGLGVTVESGPEGIEVVVRDGGPGIEDVGGIPDDRLGLRGSIFARMAAVGGVAELTTRRGDTRVTMRWHR